MVVHKRSQSLSALFFGVRSFFTVRVYRGSIGDLLGVCWGSIRGSKRRGQGGAQALPIALRALLRVHSFFTVRDPLRTVGSVSKRARAVGAAPR
eukprot:1186621-Prorocentrum_minimum.AAC.5